MELGMICHVTRQPTVLPSSHADSAARGSDTYINSSGVTDVHHQRTCRHMDSEFGIL